MIHAASDVPMVVVWGVQTPPPRNSEIIDKVPKININKSSLGYMTQPEDGLKYAETCSCFFVTVLTVQTVHNIE
jgi:hypothetical protein